MNSINAQAKTGSQTNSKSPLNPPELITLFSVVKPFEGANDLRQRNAIASWKALGADVRIILFFDSPPPADIENEFECQVIEKLNELGTPLLDDVFSRVSLLTDSPVLIYSNADMMFDYQLIESIFQLNSSELDKFLAIGRRLDVDIDERIDCSSRDWAASLLESEIKTKKASIVCKDYFVFPRGIFESVPSFAVGRGNWDNWMVQYAKENEIPVVDLSERVVAIHQNHDYQHVSGGRFSAYVNGAEARENQRLANGRNLINGSTCNWRLTAEGVVQDRFGKWRFWNDTPNFLRLMRNLLFFRR